LGIGTNAPTEKVTIIGTTNSRINFKDPSFDRYVNLGISNTGEVRLNRTGTASWQFLQIGDNTSLTYLDQTNLIIRRGGDAETARFFSTGNFGIGTGASDSGQRLQVHGTSFFSDSVGIGSASFLSNNSLRVAKNITGDSTSYGISSSGSIQSVVTSGAYMYVTGPKTQAATFTLSNLYHYGAIQGALGANSVITSQYGYHVDSSLTGATNNYGFYGNIPNGTNRWNLFMNGTADNYLAGKLVIGTTSVGTHALDVVGTTQISGNTFVSAGNLSIFTTNTPRRINVNVPNGSVAAAIGIESSGTIHSAIGIDTATTTFLQIASTQGIAFYSGSTIGNIVTQPTNERMRLTAAGRLLLGTTTESTFALDVNGTARVSGAVNLATSSGNVGIGVTGGVLKLDVQGNAADTTTVGGVTVEQVTLFRPSNGVGGIRSGFNTTTGHAYIWSSTSGGNLNFGTRSAPDNNVGMTLTFGGNLLVGTTADIASSKVTISSTTQGFLPPRMTTTQKNAIGTPAQGLMVFDTTLVKLCVYNGTTWETITSV
jgi:hypothetical protein